MSRAMPQNSARFKQSERGLDAELSFGSVKMIVKSH
jgi:hypothetical protein